MQHLLQKMPLKISQDGLCCLSEKNSLKLIEIGSDKTVILQNVRKNFRSTNKLLIKVQDHPSPKVLIFFLSKKSYVKDLRRQKQCADKAFLCLSINLLQGFSTFLSFWPLLMKLSTCCIKLLLSERKAYLLFTWWSFYVCRYCF